MTPDRTRRSCTPKYDPGGSFQTSSRSAPDPANCIQQDKDKTEPQDQHPAGPEEATRTEDQTRQSAIAKFRRRERELSRRLDGGEWLWTR